MPDFAVTPGAERRCMAGWLRRTGSESTTGQSGAYPHTTVKALEDHDGFLADCDAARGAITVGRTEHEALEEMRSALVDWASLMLWRGQPLPDIAAAARNDEE